MGTLRHGKFIWGFPKIMGNLCGGPRNKDYSILGSMLGFPYFGKVPYGLEGLEFGVFRLQD